MKRVAITNKKHPHYGEIGTLMEEEVTLSLAFLGKMDLIKSDSGQSYYAKKEDYKTL